MIIRKIRMLNFRGFREKTIDFHDKPVVLLSAANGIGKTTTIDAIEWCLTGEIGRLKASFDSRSTNDGDRKKNAAGILKNRQAGKNENVKVELGDDKDLNDKMRSLRDLFPNLAGLSGTLDMKEYSESGYTFKKS